MDEFKDVFPRGKENTVYSKYFVGQSYLSGMGKEPRELKPGDAVNIPAEVKHWHGAAPDSWFSHVAVEVPGIETKNLWPALV